MTATPPDVSLVADQLAEALAERLTPILALGGPDGYAQADEIADRLARLTAGPLCSPDPRERAQTVIDLASALDLGPDTDPEWWGTAPGRLVAGSLAGDDGTGERVTHRVAADMLGLARGTIATMVDRGTLDRHPDGGVLLSSVFLRLATHGRRT